MIRKVIRWLSSPRGQALLEFAFVAPIVLVFLFAVVDFGIAIDRRITLQHAVREGARKGAVTDDMTEIVNTTVDQSQGLLEPADVLVCYEDADVPPNGNPGDPGDNVHVQATFTYEFTVAVTEMFNFFGASLPTGIDMTPSADMRLENSVAGAPAC